MQIYEHHINQEMRALFIWTIYRFLVEGRGNIKSGMSCVVLLQDACSSYIAHDLNGYLSEAT